MNKPVRILGIGSPLVDALAHVSDEFVHSVPAEKGGMQLVENSLIQDIIERHGAPLHQAPGGSAANTIVGLAKLGIACAFLGKLGKDDLANFYEDRLSSSGVDLGNIKYCERFPTGRCLSLVTPDAERTFMTHLGAACQLLPEDIHPTDFIGYSHVHVEGHLLHNEALVEKILRCAHEAGCKISYDLGHFEVVQEKLSYLEELIDTFVDMVFANEEEANAYGKSTDLLVALDKLASHCNIAAVKMGSEGSWIQQGDKRVHVKAEPARALDTTGAGDFWSVGFLWAHYWGLSLEECGYAGSLLGAAVVERIGALLPDEEWLRLKEKLYGLKYCDKHSGL